MKRILLIAFTAFATLVTAEAQEVKNIIFLIGDGMGLASASMMQLENNYAPTIFDEADNVALQKTYSLDNRVTDSAASGTALATGFKTNNTMLGQLPNGTNVESLMELAADRGKATGLVVTTYLQHATPGAFYAHVPSRHEYATISEQLLASDIDIAIGGGMAFFEERYGSNEAARKAIAGMMELAPSITAFGNTNPTSYFRLVPHQEAPTNICWGDRNRSVLVRVPLGWTAKSDMCQIANPLEKPHDYDTSQKQTVEMRSPDGSADVYELIAGLVVACRYGFELDNALEIAEKTYVNVNIHKKENEHKLKDLAQLPDSCAASADCLERQRNIFEARGVFSPAMIDGILKSLRSFDDRTLREDIGNDRERMLELVHRFFHCG